MDPMLEYLTHLISPHSMSVYGSSVGHSNFTENDLAFLSHNTTCKLYQILKECKSEMSVYRQTKLSNKVLENVLHNAGFPKIFGNKTEVSFLRIPNADISVRNDPVIDILSEGIKTEIEVELLPQPILNGKYVLPMLVNYSTQPPVNNLNMNHLNNHVKKELIEDEMMDVDIVVNFYKCPDRQLLNKTENGYFLIASQILLDSGENIFKVLLEDIRTNSNLGNVPYKILKLIENSIKHFRCVGKLVDRLLRAVNALIENPHIDPSSSDVIDDAIRTLSKLVIDPKILIDCDDYAYRVRASSTLMKAFNSWNININIKCELKEKLTNLLESPDKYSLKENYCVLTLLYAFGCDNMDVYLWPAIIKYLHCLTKWDNASMNISRDKKKKTSFMAELCLVKHTLKNLSGILYRNFWSNDENTQRMHIKADHLLYEYFGDSINPLRWSAAVPRKSGGASPVFAQPAVKQFPPEPISSQRWTTTTTTTTQHSNSTQCAVVTRKRFLSAAAATTNNNTPANQSSPRRNFELKIPSVVGADGGHNNGGDAFYLNQSLHLPSSTSSPSVIVNDQAKSRRFSFRMKKNRLGNNCNKAAHSYDDSPSSCNTPLDQTTRFQRVFNKSREYLRYQKQIRCIKYCEGHKWCATDLYVII